MTTAIIVQARMTSTRLPGKVLAPVGGRPMLGFQLARLAGVRTPHVTIVATTTNAEDEAVVPVAHDAGATTFRGAEWDVLGRYADAVASVGAGTVVRLTADCPLIDPRVVDRGLERFAAGGCAYLSNTLERTYPRGQDVEVFSADALREAAATTTAAADREHVTPFLYRVSGRFATCQFRHDRDLSDRRWTVDVPEDLELVRRLVDELGSRALTADVDEIAAVEDRHPDWKALNATVEQRSFDHAATHG